MEMLWSIFYVIFLGIVSHFWGQALPRERFREDRIPWRAFAFEKEGSIYRRLGVHKWRDKLPDMSRYLSDMVPKRFSPHMTLEEVQVLIKETCVAEYVHIWLCIAFIGVFWIWKNSTGIWLWLIYTTCNVPYIIIQRYNRPLLCRLQKRLILRNTRDSSENMLCQHSKKERLAPEENGGNL